jgi:DNA polymerase-3 subunit alpha
MPDFNHLHVHTQFSLLDGAADISKMMKKASADGMKAMAITDHGNMFGVFKFVAEAAKAGIKPIVGCEFYMVNDRHKRQFTKEDKDIRYHQLLLAKNEEGYRNLVKLCSLGYVEGLYGKYPRIDKELILKYHKGLIATTCCLGAIVPKTILKKGETEGEKEFLWWLDLFGEDYYIELQRHHIPEQEELNRVLLKFAAKHNVKIIASNDSHYVDQKDSNAHDILLCINTGEKQSTPSSKDFADDEAMPKGTRFAFFNDQFYFKNTAEMNQLFSDLPEAIDNTNEIVDKVDTLKLKRDILLPNFPIPEHFKIHEDDAMNQWEYLKDITFKGAAERYSEMTAEIEERLNFELFTIRTMGFAGYFLIVADFIKAGRDMGVFVGPGRGSAAGSAVAYCIGITNIDPIKYDLLFERFLNPERKSMPDIDTDFDDEGRQKVIDYVVDKYGKNQVAQIVTYGTMAARTSIQDVARVLDMPLNDMNDLKKLVPETLGISLNRIFNAPLEGPGSLKEKENLDTQNLDNVKKLRELKSGNDQRAAVLREAEVLEGSVRNTGIHAAGIIIAPEDLTSLIPVATVKDSDLLVTQYEGKVIEDAGVIKMDFLGLKTLTILKDALRMIKENHGVEINLDTIPLDDLKTLELYQRGETVGTFQFESAGMQKYLKDLKPDKFEDLIAMNALYRPGPLEYIPNYIKRKHGQEKIAYDLPEMQEYLEETYGITVYQEQVMLLSQKLAGFTKGEADTLRKAMGKKDRATLDKLKPKFIENAVSKGHPEEQLQKIWTDWEAFASYAFNKSHSTCYAFVAFQTGYLKAHYPSEYMAAVLNNSKNIEDITFFMEECKRMGINVLGPDVNESDKGFSVNARKEIRFGLNAVKGVGEAAVDSIVEERHKGGTFNSIFDLVRRINQKATNRKSLESLALAGAFDSFEGVHRAQYFAEDSTGGIAMDKILRFASSYRNAQESNSVSLFGETSDSEIPEPVLPVCEPWEKMRALSKEKEVVGMYLSGHPLDEFKHDMTRLSVVRLSNLSNLSDYFGKTVSFAGIVTQAEHKLAKSGNPYGFMMIEDFDGPLELRLYGKDYDNFRAFMVKEEKLFFTAKVQERYSANRQDTQGQKPDPEKMELKIQKIELLNRVRERALKSITVNMHLSDINEYNLSTLMDIFTKHQGKYMVNFTILDEEEKLILKSPAENMKVNATNEFLMALEELSFVKFKLN